MTRRQQHVVCGCVSSFGAVSILAVRTDKPFLFVALLMAAAAGAFFGSI